MLPRKLHIEQINRFHDHIDSLSEKIKKAKANGENTFDLVMEYFELTSKTWCELDNSIESVKYKLDSYEK